ncbi:MAG: glycosyltransferase, partial [Planctomycetota bacterium]
TQNPGAPGWAREGYTSGSEASSASRDDGTSVRGVGSNFRRDVCGSIAAMRFVLATFGSWGDVKPFAAIARRARRIGHDAVVVTDVWYADRLRARGVEVAGFDAGLDPDLPKRRPEIMHRWKGTGIFFREVLSPALAPMYQATRAAIDALGADMVLCHHVAWGAMWAAQEMEAPWSMAAMAPASWMSLENPNMYPVMPDRDHYRMWALKLGNAVSRRVVRAMTDGVANRARCNLGLPAQRDVMLARTFGGHMNLGLWSPQFRGPAGDDHAASHVTGFPLESPDAEPELDPAIETFLDDGAPPVLITLGTSAGAISSEVPRMVAGVCAASRRRALILVGNRESLPREMPPGIAAFEHAPYARVMPRCAAVVHHGGVGTTSEVLRAGKPAVIVPFAHDQFDNARRCRMAGCSVTLDRRTLNAARIQTALDRVTDTATFAEASERMRASIEQEDGLGTALSLLAPSPVAATATSDGG